VYLSSTFVSSLFTFGLADELLPPPTDVKRLRPPANPPDEKFKVIPGKKRTFFY